MKTIIAFILLLGSNSAFAVAPGQACSPRDRDPLKCMACAIKGEDNKSIEGMLAVGGVIMTRKHSGRFGSSVCAIVHAPGQFVGARGRLPTGAVYNQIIAASKKSLQSRGNGFLGFRSYCRRGDKRIGKGGNCYRRSTEVLPSGLATDSPREMAVQEIESLISPQLNMAEIEGTTATN